MKLYAPKPKREDKECYTWDEVHKHLEELNEWENTSINGWIERSLFNPIWRFFYNKEWRRIEFWFKPANVVKVKRHSRYANFSTPELMFHANFQMLLNFFENEKGWIDHFIKTEWTEEELQEEENLFKEGRGMGREWCEDRMAEWKEIFALKDWYENSTNKEMDNMLYGMTPDGNKIDDNYRVMCNEKLKRLIELRELLWT